MYSFLFANQCENLKHNPPMPMRASKRIHSTPNVRTMSKTLFKNEIGATKHTFSKPFYIVKNLIQKLSKT